MLPTVKNDVISSDIGQDELSFLFSQMVNAPQQTQETIIQTLENITSVQTLSHPFPTTFKISALKYHYKQQHHYLRLFPNVFIQHTAITPFEASWRNKLMLKWTSLPFSVGDNNLLQLKTLTFTKLSLLLQMLIYLSENETIEPSDLTHAKQSSTAVYLNQQLGATYSQGQYLDFVDRLYDQYKHTKLTPYVFRHLFRCFGCHTPTIANAAFDYYMQSRNSERAWQLAVANFLQNKLFMTESLVQSVSKLLVQNSHLSY